ncbi:hypothetical protein AMS68_007130 [Peltaster fructicola]|uniref:Glutamine amidotransferase type-2 domain-containing protein n=1 Tax=Peltaster fructicola TaxID=286661 RepID=A0A6H0Y3N9_9PEZI|nr:hypothetical protein AMS68_007130 [Peltaster fructicola]
MCGILFSLSTRHSVEPDAEILTVLQRRGPDSTTSLTRTASVTPDTGSSKQFFLSFTSTVLALRGDTVVKQPYFDHTGQSILCWNGEAWRIAGESLTGNDTEQVFSLLDQRTPDKSLSAYLANLAARLSTVAGPYAFVFFDWTTKRIVFGRDFLGRRSLLWCINDGNLLICSVSTGDSSGPWQEVEADGIYCIELNAASKPDSQMSPFEVSKQPYDFRYAARWQTCSVLPFLTVSKETGCKYGTDANITADKEVVSMVHTQLSDALRARVLDIPEPPCETHTLPVGSRLAILFSGGLDCTLLARLAHDLLPVNTPIDLLNVAFENPRIHKNLAEDGPSAYELCPDRVTGRASFKELLEVCPRRPWRFVACNIPYAEFLEHRSTIVMLIYPHSTEMDLSIACALYFAARGSGLLSTAEQVDITSYSTSARVLLSGLGADELFAGYTRHYTTYSRGGLSALQAELELDIGRLSKRNLGRDDRATAHWSKEVRHPFLDEAFVQWALDCPIVEKCGFGEHHDSDPVDSAALIPDKKLLRCLAWKLGMKNVAKEKKRAAQHCSLDGLRYRMPLSFRIALAVTSPRIWDVKFPDARRHKSLAPPLRETAKRLLRQLNSRWIFGRYPLLHAIIFLVEVTMVSILIRKFNGYYDKRPVFTTMITNAVLGGIADTVAQTLTAIRVRQRQRKLSRSGVEESNGFLTMDMQEMDNKVPWPENDYMNPNRLKPPPFDFERMVRFMSYPFIMSPVQHKWFSTLNRLFPMTAGAATANAFKRVAFDQLLFAPIGLGLFFTFMTVAEGGGRRAVAKKFQDVYIPALKANFLVWPAVQLLNFRVIPIQFQIPFVSTIGIAWTAYLSLTNSAEERIETPA